MALKTTLQNMVTLLLLVMVASSLMLIQTGEAQPDSTITVPDDYPTISAAIGNATNGDTIFVKAGTYSEQALIINKTLTLKGEDRASTFINLTPALVGRRVFGMNDVHTEYVYEHPLLIEASTVKLSGFTINNTITAMIELDWKTEGQSLVKGDRAQIVDNTIIAGIFGLTGSNQVFAKNNVIKTTVNCGGSHNAIVGNTFTGSVEAIGAYGSSNVIYDNIVSYCSLGIGSSEDGNRIFNNTIFNCKTGVSVGLYGAGNLVYSNRIVNSTCGIRIGSQGNDNAAYANTVVDCLYAVEVDCYFPIGTSTVYHNNFENNTNPIQINNQYQGGTFDNGKEGNYWSDYAGEDANGDGIGDSPYVIDSSRSDNYPLMQPFDISTVPLDLPDWAYVLPTPTPPASIHDAASASTQIATGALNQNTTIVIAVLLATAALLVFVLIKRRTQ